MSTLDAIEVAAWVIALPTLIGVAFFLLVMGLGVIGGAGAALVTRIRRRRIS